ncbi:hypothetical protein HK102_000734 [Quaeritorhiza haematococci]|nr:hypothetical protein HK102_000734 [Quaeritorhiza haematococci]
MTTILKMPVAPTINVLDIDDILIAVLECVHDDSSFLGDQSSSSSSDGLNQNYGEDRSSAADLVACVQCCKRWYHIGMPILWKRQILDTKIPGKCAGRDVSFGTKLTKASLRGQLHNDAYYFESLCHPQHRKRLEGLHEMIHAPIHASTPSSSTSSSTSTSPSSSMQLVAIPPSQTRRTAAHFIQRINVRLTFFLEFMAGDASLRSPWDYFDEDDLPDRVKQAAWEEFLARSRLIVDIVCKLQTRLHRVDILLNINMGNRTSEEVLDFHRVLSELAAACTAAACTAAPVTFGSAGTGNETPSRFGAFADAHSRSPSENGGVDASVSSATVYRPSPLLLLSALRKVTVTLGQQASIDDPRMLSPLILHLGRKIKEFRVQRYAGLWTSAATVALLSDIGPLEVLELCDGARVNDAVLDTLKTCGHVKTLRRFRVSAAGVLADDIFFSEFVPSCRRLKSLIIDGAGLIWNRKGVVYNLGNSGPDVVNGISRNSIDGNHDGSGGSLSAGKSLEELDVTQCVRLPHSFFDAVAKTCVNLRIFIAAHTSIQDEHISTMAGTCKRLTLLDVSMCQGISVKSLMALAAARMVHLRELNIVGCNKIISPTKHMDKSNDSVPASLLPPIALQNIAMISTGCIVLLAESCRNLDTIKFGPNFGRKEDDMHWSILANIETAMQSVLQMGEWNGSLQCSRYISLSVPPVRRLRSFVQGFTGDVDAYRIRRKYPQGISYFVDLLKVVDCLLILLKSANG